MITTKISGNSPMRTLFIDFDAYTDGDAEFKAELIVLMIDNLMELQETLQRAVKNNDNKLYHGVCHKIKATIEMLADPEFSQAVEALKVSLADAEKVVLLLSISTDIMEGLRRESI
jgi:hypothetical protein